MTGQGVAPAPQEADGTLVLEYGGRAERYSMVQKPGDGSALVRDALGLVLDDLDVGAVATNLRRASDMMYVAYAGTTGTPGRAQVSDCLSDLLQLCDDIAMAMVIFQGCCDGGLGSLVRCFRRLLSGEETEAMSDLAEGSSAAKRIRGFSTGFRDRLGRLSEKTYAVYSWTLQTPAAPRGELDQIERLRTDLSTSLFTRERARHELNGSIERLQELREQLAVKDRTGAEREFVTAIVRAVGGVTSEGPGGFAALMTATGRADADAATASERRVVVQKKIELEKEYRSASATAARLVGKLGTGDRQTVMALATVASLAAATWALTQASAAMDLATNFWATVETGCYKVENTTRSERVSATSGRVGPAVRIAYYDAAPFKEEAVRYLASWRAMQMSYGSVKTSIADVQNDVRGRLAGSPNAVQPGLRLSDLRDRTMTSLQQEEGDHAKRAAALAEAPTATGR